MLEDVPLTFDDISIMLTNLEADAFTGYVRMDLGGSDGYIYYSHGSMVRAIEIIRGGEMKVRPLPRLLNMVKQAGSAPTSSYVMSGKIVNVLSSSFAFKPLYMDYQVKRKELKKVLTNLEHDEFSGVLQFEGPDGRVSVLLDRGEPVHDQFAHHYGQVLCGRDAINGLFDYVHQNGSTIQVYAEKANEIDAKRRAVEEELEKIRQLIIKQESGMFRAQDVVRVAEEIVREWGLDVKATFNVLIETPSGEIHKFKCQGAKKLGAYAGIHQNLLKTVGVKDGDLVNVSPAGDV